MFMQTIRYYIKAHRKELLVFPIGAGILLGIGALYEVNLESILYGLLLCLVILLVFHGIEWFRFYKKFCVWKQQKEKLGTRELELYQSDNPMEQEYTQALTELSNRYSDFLDGTKANNRERQEYYQTWVHQIKTPIAAINMLLQEDSAENRAIRNQVFRIEEYVEMVLCQARLEEGNSDFVFDTFSLDELLRKSIRKYAPLFIQKKISLSYDGVETNILTDEKWFCFLVEQLLSNAIKYTVAGTVQIRLETGNILAIQDTGIGIAPEDIPRIFEKGFTGYNGRAGEKSTGIGLFLCKKCADKLGYRLWIESKVGVGTTCFIDVSRREITPE